MSPVRGQKATEEQKVVAFEMVKYLTKELRIDCLALGEVSSEDLENIAAQPELNDYELYNGTFKTGRLRFDIGVLYRKDMLHLFSHSSITVRRGTRSLKVANQLDFVIPGSEELLHIFVSHWPSRLWCEEHGEDRHLLGVTLREKVVALNRLYNAPAKVILLGDYNAEPHSSSLEGQLLAVRDRRLVRRNPELLYNPFWRHLGESQPYAPDELSESNCGTYYWKPGLKTQWHTFDQIIVSSAFLGQSEWRLNENLTQILRGPPFDHHISTRDNLFDHFPVLSVIERSMKDD